MRCNVLPAAGRLVWSRVVNVGPAGVRLTGPDNQEGIPLPKGRNTIGWQIGITARPTITGGTPTYLMYALQAPLDSARVLAAMVNGGYGELLAPGQSTVIDLAADVDRVNLDLLGVEDDFDTEAAITVFVSIKELVPLVGVDECGKKGC